MEILNNGFEDAMAVMVLPLKYRKFMRSINILERENREMECYEKLPSIKKKLRSA